MKLLLHDKDNIVDLDFGNWLLELISTKLISSIDSKKLQQLDDFINNTDTLKRLYKSQYSTESILIYAARHLKCNVVHGEITIDLDNNALVPGFDRLKLLTICKLINYGSSEVKGYPIFTNTFNYFRDNITDYVRMYYVV